jgi:hypothetical protein
MSICYWQLCHCPDATPCDEHQGFDCSLVDGIPITSESQIKDPVTRSLEAALLVLTSDQTRIDAVRNQIETRLTELQREMNEIEGDANAATDRHERSVVSDHATRANERAKQIADELGIVMDELDAMVARWQTAIAAASSRLIIPYADVVGYCACYDRKKQRLAVIGTQIANEQAIYGALLAQFNGVRATVLANAMNIKNWTGGLVGLAILFAWLWFAFNKTAAIAILIALVVMALALLALILHLLNLQSQMNAAQRRLAALILMYYRLQQISTCRKEDSDADDDSEWFKSFFDRLNDPLF